MRLPFILLIIVSFVTFVAFNINAQTTTATNTTTSTLTPSTSTSSPSSSTTTATTVDPSSTTATNRVPPERLSNSYTLKLDGTHWAGILERSRTSLWYAVASDLAGRFSTEFQYINIKNMTIGSLIVDFSVFPEGDGSQIRESAFLSSAANRDSSWLVATQPIYQAASGGVATSVTASSYSDSNQTSPPTMIRCSDGCTGALAAAGAVLALVCIFVALAWLRYTKKRDEEERRKLGIASAGDFPVVISSNNNNNNNSDSASDIVTESEMVIPQRKIITITSSSSSSSNNINNSNNYNNNGMRSPRGNSNSYAVVASPIPRQNNNNNNNSSSAVNIFSNARSSSGRRY